MGRLPVRSKTEIIKILHDTSGTTKVQVEFLTNQFLSQIRQQVSDGKRVSLGSFGIFERRLWKARKGRNPRTGEPVDIPKKWKIKFIPAKAFNDEVNE